MSMFNRNTVEWFDTSYLQFCVWWHVFSLELTVVGAFISYKLASTKVHSFFLICELGKHLPVHIYIGMWSVGSVAQSCSTLCNPMDCSTPGFPVHHQLPELAQTHVHQVGDAIQAAHPLSSPSPPAFNLSQHQVLFQWFSCLYQVAKGLELQLQYQSFQWTFRTYFL